MSCSGTSYHSERNGGSAVINTRLPSIPTGTLLDPIRVIVHVVKRISKIKFQALHSMHVTLLGKPSPIFPRCGNNSKFGYRFSFTVNQVTCRRSPDSGLPVFAKKHAGACR
jgi:hypothetical protein